MELEKIREHWEAMGRSFPKDGNITPTSRDPYLGTLERNNVLGCLDKSFKVLEVGCGDASHLVEYSKHVKHITGVDYASSLIEIAKKRAAGLANVEFKVASVLDLDKEFSAGEFDCIISQRCLINLSNWEEQTAALTILHGLLKKGGLFIMTEGFNDELRNLNKLRAETGLSTISVAEYNRNFEHAEFDPFISSLFRVDKIMNYGAYMFFSRVYHPLSVAPDQPKHDSKLNEIGMILGGKISGDLFSGYSYNLLYKLIKI